MENNLVIDQAKVEAIRVWLGTGSVNIFGMPMSGKDTVGVKLAELIGARFLSSGMIIRAMEQETRQKLTNHGDLAPSDLFLKWVLPYFERQDLKTVALILSSVGRWVGEEDAVMAKAAETGHEIKAAVLLNVSEAEVWARWEAVKNQGAREGQAATRREDDRSRTVFQTRLDEFRQKTMPAVEHYRQLGLLSLVHAGQSREAVLAETVESLWQKTKN